MVFLFLLLISQNYEPQSGDIVFHVSKSGQSQAIQKATHSLYSHMGLVFVEDGIPYVFEAVQPVKKTPIKTWLSRGKGGHFVVKRLRNAKDLLTPAALGKLREVLEPFLGKSYDLYFEWSDDRIYCSELVWKAYHRSLGLEIGKKQKLRAFDFSDPVVKAKLAERWKGSQPNWEEPVISPQAMFESDLLITVFENG